MTARKPAEQKRLTGNPGKHPIPEPLVVIEGKFDPIPDPPADLGPLAKKRWLQLWGTAGAWLHSTTDITMLVRYCKAHDEEAYWRTLIKKEGRMSRGSTGQPKVHPAVDELGKLHDRMTRWETVLGFNPAGRASLRIEKRAPKQERKIDRFTKAAANSD